MSRHTPHGATWDKVRRRLLATSDVCHVCGHPGSTDADHLIEARHLQGLAKLDIANLRPAHGVKGCPTCGRKCNQERSARSVRATTSRRW